MDIFSHDNLGLVATIAYLYAEMINKLAILVYVIALERRRRRKRPRIAYDRASRQLIRGVPPSLTNDTATSQPSPSQAAPTKKIRRKRSLDQDVGIDEFTSTIRSIGTWIDSFGEHISRLASCFQFLVDEAEAKKKVYTELLKIEGLSQRERIKAGELIVSDTSKVSYFFSLPDECTKDYVAWVLGGCQ
ncbi:hypothetical protein J5N97_026547 [Dioscorea zingiberensis]|uniref:Uncharacterized protein n=1 Tax=Dioscorea zingiberensis TaxID=325984 RepID=A0A9D5C3D2_9LILI|nr:hypothetical protein J5N97_026547 [Dioscorea zingiberensis]